MLQTKSENLPIKRIYSLDGLRGLAVTAVLFFHIYTRWCNLVPYGQRYANFPLFKYGSMGVFLFFLISGFVIFLTLEKCSSFRQFIIKRWLRLFPAMLIATVLIYLTSSLFPERPLGVPVLRDMVPGLSFIYPFIWEKIFGSGQGMLEGSFWTLFVEALFYLVFGLSYFFMKRKSVWVLIALGIVGYFTRLLAYFGYAGGLNSYIDLLGLKYFCWFAAGALAYLYFNTKQKSFLYYYLLIGVFCVVTMITPSSLTEGIVATLIVMLFITPFISEKTHTFFSNKAVVFLGFISYPLYLIHENFVISMIIKLNKVQHIIPVYLLPILPVVFLVLLAYFIAKYLEPFVRQVIIALTTKSRILISYFVR